jgi:hypothetical protein
MMAKPEATKAKARRRRVAQLNIWDHVLNVAEPHVFSPESHQPAPRCDAYQQGFLFEFSAPITPPSAPTHGLCGRWFAQPDHVELGVAFYYFLDRGHERYTRAVVDDFGDLVPVPKMWFGDRSDYGYGRDANGFCI